MTIESPFYSPAEAVGPWPALAERFRQLMEKLFPAALPGELSGNASLRGLEAHLSSGSLPQEHEALLKDYLDSLPGYGNPDWREEAERHHGFVASYYLRRSVEQDHN